MTEARNEKQNETRSPGILIVDDEPGAARYVDTILSDLTDDRVVVHSGAEAIDICQRRAFDVVISDMQMPGMDGVELLRLLAHDYPSMRRIVLTGHADFERAAAAINAGRVHKYLTKPCPAEQMLDTVNQELEAARRERLEITRLRETIATLASRRDDD